MTGEEAEFTPAPYDQADTGSVADPGGQGLLVNAWCEHGDCPNHEEDPAEPAWVRLMSAVPRADQVGNMGTARVDIPLPDLASGLKTLLESWTGTDADAFEDEVNVVLRNINLDQMTPAGSGSVTES